MAYDKQDLFKRCIEAASDKTKNLHFLEDVRVEVGISASTFYEYFPKDSEGYKEIVGLIKENRVRTKKSMRKKWYDSDHPTLQVALYKLLGTNFDRKKLTQSHIDATTKGDKINLDSKEVAIKLQELLDDAKTDTSDTPDN